MRGYWLLPAISFGLILNAILTQNFLFYILAFFWFIRVIFFRDLKIISWSILFFLLAIIFGIYSLNKDKDYEIPRGKIVIIDPSSVRVNGNLAQMSGKADNKRVLVTAKLNSKDEQKAIQTNSRWFYLKVDKEYEQIQGAHNFSEFDYRLFEHRQKHCDATVFIDKLQPVFIKTSFINCFSVFKQKIAIYFNSFPKYTKQFLLLLLGIRDDKETSEKMSQLGLLSLFSLSGIQLFWWLKTFRNLGAQLRIRSDLLEWIILVILILLVLNLDQGLGIQRSACFLFLTQSNKLLKFGLPRSDIWSFFLIGSLLYRPYILFSLGGSLSFLITFFLLVKKRESGFVTNLKINLLILPIVLQNVYVWYLITLLANFIFLPILNLLLPLFCFNILFHFGPIDQFTNFICYCLSSLIHFVSNINILKVYFGQIPLIMVVILTFISLFIFTKNNWSMKLNFSLGSLYLLCFLMIHFPLTGRVVMFDIGQGDSFLIETPFHRQLILIDTGGKLNFKQEDWQKRQSKTRVETITLNYLYSRGIDHLDAVVTTHQDADHIGDLPVLINKMKIDKLIFGWGIMNNPNYRKKVVPLAKRTEFIEAKAGKSLLVNGLALNILNPTEPGSGENKDSVTFLVDLEGTRYLFTGDLDRAGEIKAMHNFNVKADVLKVGHHGSKTSSDPEFIKAVQPKIALISAGRNNRYGHPNSETIDTLDKYHVHFFDTKDSGMVILEYNKLKKGIVTFINGSK